MSVAGETQTTNVGNTNPDGPEIVLDGSYLVEGYGGGSFSKSSQNLLGRRPDSSANGARLADRAERQTGVVFTNGGWVGEMLKQIAYSVLDLFGPDSAILIGVEEFDKGLVYLQRRARCCGSDPQRFIELKYFSEVVVIVDPEMIGIT